MKNAPYVRETDYDHDDVEVDYPGSFTDVMFDLGLAIVMFLLLMFAIFVLLNMPHEWIANMLLQIGGV